jgi:hypothetical protein
VSVRGDVDVAIPERLLRPPHRVSVGFGNRSIDFGGESTACQRWIPRKPRCQKRIDLRKRFSIGDQVRPEHDRLKGAVVDITCLK